MSGSKVAGAVIGLSAFVACPCHLAITLPLAIALFGGSAVGAFLSANTALVVGLAALWFVAGLALAWRLLSRPDPRADAQAASPRQLHIHRECR
jgi:mercuric ion transport protein